MSTKRKWKISVLFKVILIMSAVLLMSACSGGEEEVPEEDLEFKIVLLPEDADLSSGGGIEIGSDMVEETEEMVSHLGNWFEGEQVSWTMEIPEDGLYHLKFEYSRPGNYGESRGVMHLTTFTGEVIKLHSKLPATGTEPDDWSVYKVKSGFGATLPAGPVILTFVTNYDEVEDKNEQFINLRSIEITPSFELGADETIEGEGEAIEGEGEGTE